jgi:S1-C subfamily serine protease
MLQLPSSLLTSLLLLTPVADGWLGIYLDSERTEALVAEVIPGSPADKAGLKDGDELLAVGDQAAATRDEFIAAIRAKKAGERIGIKLRRDGKEMNVVVKLGERPETIAAPQAVPSEKVTQPQAPAPRDEAVARPTERAYLGLSVREGDEGVEIERVLPDGPAHAAGLANGDMLTKVGDRRIEKLTDLDAALQNVRPGQQIAVALRNDAGSRSVMVTAGKRPATAPAPLAERQPALAPRAQSTPSVTTRPAPAAKSDAGEPRRESASNADLEAELKAMRAELAELRKQLEALRKGLGRE